MESLTTEILAKSRCFPVKILFINHSRVIIWSNISGSIEDSPKSSSNLLFLVDLAFCSICKITYPAFCNWCEGRPKNHFETSGNFHLLCFCFCCRSGVLPQIFSDHFPSGAFSSTKINSVDLVSTDRPLVGSVTSKDKPNNRKISSGVGPIAFCTML